MKLRNFIQLMPLSEAGIVTSENLLTWEGLRAKKFDSASYYLSHKNLKQNAHYGWVLLGEKWREELSAEENENTPDPDCIMVDITTEEDDELWFLLWKIDDIE